MKTMVTHKIELAVPLLGLVSGAFVEDAILKILVTVIAMVIGQTVAFYWKKYLEKKSK